MWQWKIWRRWSPERIGKAISSLFPSHRRLVVLTLIFFFCVVPAVSAEGSVGILSRENDYAFSEFLQFSLEAEAEAPITEIILFYGQADEPLVRRIYPSFSPGKRVQVEHTETLERGQFAPGTRLRTWWELHTTDTTFETEIEQFTYTDNNHDWHKVEGPRVDVYWYGDGESRAERLVTSAEDTLAHLESEVGVAVEERISIYVYNDQRDMQRAVSPRSEGYDERVMTLGMTSGKDTLLLLGSHRDVTSTMAHELSHIVVGLSTDNPYTDLPRWLDEGLAMYAEGELPAGNRRALERAIEEDALLSVRSMSSYTGRAGEVDLFYGEAYSIVSFLLEEYGREDIRRLLDLFSRGMRQEEALQEAYDFGLQELDDRWRESLGLEPRPRPTERSSPQPKEEEERTKEERVSCPSLLGAMVLPLGSAALAARAKRYP